MFNVDDDDDDACGRWQASFETKGHTFIFRSIVFAQGKQRQQQQKQQWPLTSATTDKDGTSILFISSSFIHLYFVYLATYLFFFPIVPSFCLCTHNNLGHLDRVLVMYTVNDLLLHHQTIVTFFKCAAVRFPIHNQNRKQYLPFLFMFSKKSGIHSNCRFKNQDELPKFGKVWRTDAGLSWWKEACQPPPVQAHLGECQLASLTATSTWLLVQKAIKQSIWLIEP